MTSAFSEFSSGPLETLRLPASRADSHPLLALTRGLSARLGAAAQDGAAAPGAHHPPAVAQLTLPDGRLHVGTHLPLLGERYRYLSTLGEGISAQVVLAEDTLAPTPGRLVAIKVMARHYALAGQREARALRYLHACAPGGTAPGLVRLLDSFKQGPHVCLVTERCYPWLLDWVADSSQLPPAVALSQLRKMAHQLLVAVAHMHASQVVMADIKPENTLMCHPPGSRSVALKLVDLGNSFSLTETDHSAVACEVQSLPYRAPEAALGLPYGAPIDLWSVGVLLAEMALKRALLPCSTPRSLLQQMVTLLGPLPESLVLSSALGQQIGTAALCGPESTTAGGAVVARLPAELQQRLAAAAEATPAPDAVLGVPPQHSRHSSCQLHAELARVDASLAGLVLCLLAYDPARRITAQQALLHPFFHPLCPLQAMFPGLGEARGSNQGAGAHGLPRAAAAAAVVPSLHPAAAPAPAQPAVAATTSAAGDGSALTGSLLPPTVAAVVAAAAAEAAAAEGAAVQAAEVKAAALSWPRQQQQPALAHSLLPGQRGGQLMFGAQHQRQPIGRLLEPQAQPQRKEQGQQPQQQEQGWQQQQQQQHQEQRQQQERQGPQGQQQQQLQGRQQLQQRGRQQQQQQQGHQQQQQQQGQQAQAEDEPLLSVSSTKEQHAHAVVQSWLSQPAAPPAAQQQQQQARLPAAQLAAEQWEESRRIAAGTPYAGNFSPRFEPTPEKACLQPPPARQQLLQHPQQRTAQGEQQQPQAPPEKQRQQPPAEPEQQGPQKREGQLDAVLTAPAGPGTEKQAAGGIKSGLKLAAGKEPASAAGQAPPGAAVANAAHPTAARRPVATARKQPRRSTETPAAVTPPPAAPVEAGTAEQLAEPKASAFDLLLGAVAEEEGWLQEGAVGGAPQQQQQQQQKEQQHRSRQQRTQDQSHQHQPSQQQHQQEAPSMDQPPAVQRQRQQQTQQQQDQPQKPRQQASAKNLPAAAQAAQAGAKSAAKAAGGAKMLAAAKGASTATKTPAAAKAASGAKTPAAAKLAGGAKTTAAAKGASGAAKTPAAAKLAGDAKTPAPAKLAGGAKMQPAAAKGASSATKTPAVAKAAENAAKMQPAAGQQQQEQQHASPQSASGSHAAVPAKGSKTPGRKVAAAAPPLPAMVAAAAAAGAERAPGAAVRDRGSGTGGTAGKAAGKQQVAGGGGEQPQQQAMTCGQPAQHDRGRTPAKRAPAQPPAAKAPAAHKRKQPPPEGVAAVAAQAAEASPAALLAADVAAATAAKRQRRERPAADKPWWMA